MMYNSVFPSVHSYLSAWWSPSGETSRFSALSLTWMSCFLLSVIWLYLLTFNIDQTDCFRLLLTLAEPWVCPWTFQFLYQLSELSTRFSTWVRCKIMRNGWHDKGFFFSFQQYPTCSAASLQFNRAPFFSRTNRHSHRGNSLDCVQFSVIAPSKSRW